MEGRRGADPAPLLVSCCGIYSMHKTEFCIFDEILSFFVFYSMFVVSLI